VRLGGALGPDRVIDCKCRNALWEGTFPTQRARTLNGSNHDVPTTH